ncbi:MAG: hypothetical protein ACP5PT_07695 [Brevinematia bacterium]
MHLKLLFVSIFVFVFTFASYPQVQVDVKIEFFNKKSIEGKLVFASSNVLLNHVENGVVLSDLVSFLNLEYIHPVTWFPEPSKFDGNKIMYNFFPIEYIVKLKDGKYLNVIGRVKEFEVIDFVHRYGKSKIYTYFVDYLVFDKIGNSKWKNTGTYELNKNFKKPHPNVAYYVYFK